MYLPIHLETFHYTYIWRLGIEQDLWSHMVQIQHLLGSVLAISSLRHPN